MALRAPLGPFGFQVTIDQVFDMGRAFSGQKEVKVMICCLGERFTE